MSKDGGVLIIADPEGRLAHHERGSLGGHILRTTGLLAGVQGLVRVLGLVEKVLLAHFFGAGVHADIYYAARRMALSLFQITDQAILHALLPVFLHRQRVFGREDAWRFASTVVNALALLTLGGVIMGILWTPSLLAWYVPDWMHAAAPHRAMPIPLLVALTRIMLVGVVFLVASSVTYSLLNAAKSFTLPAASDLVLRGSVVLCALLWAPTWGVLALAIGFVAGALGKLGVQCWGLRAHHPHYRTCLDWQHPGITGFLTLVLPLLLGVVVSVGRQLLDTRMIASLPLGSLSALEYTESLCNVPVQLCALTFGIVIFPYLSDFFTRNALDDVRHVLQRSFALMLILTLPLTVLFLLWRTPILVSLYGGGAMDPSAFARMGPPFTVATVAIVVESLEILLLQVFFAGRNTWTPILIGLGTTILHVGLAALGIYALQVGVVAIPLALLVSRVTKVAILRTVLRQRWGLWVGMGERKLLTAVLLALLPYGGLLIAAAAVLPVPPVTDGVGARWLGMLPYALIGMGSLALYFGVLHRIQPETLQPLWRAIRQNIRHQHDSAVLR